MSADDKTESEVGTQEASTDGSTSQPKEPKEPETLMEANPMGLATILNSGMVYYERLPMLEVVSDRLVRLMTTSMRNLTGDNVEINLESITSVRFGDYVHSIPQPSMINVFVAEEWDNHGIVMLDSELIYSMIDVLLGGRKGSSSVRPENPPAKYRRLMLGICPCRRAGRRDGNRHSRRVERLPRRWLHAAEGMIRQEP